MRHPPSASLAHISEIFSSLQGEGTRLGERHLFIRFEECHIHCEYCDELDKQGMAMTLEQVMETVHKLEKEEGPHSFVSLTGGEPLLYLSFLKPLMPRLKKDGFRIYLETNGILCSALQEVIGWCDVIAMDMKPASVTKERSFEEEHRKFLQIAKAKETFIKIILSREIDIKEFQNLIQLGYEEARQVPVLLQPISAEVEGHDDPHLMELLMELQRIALELLTNVRIVPRLHRILKIQ